MKRICFPVRWFATTRDNYTRTISGAARRSINGSGEVHEQGHRANNSLGTVHESQQFTESSFPPQVNDSV